jgi:hypothetical protein
MPPRSRTSAARKRSPRSIAARSRAMRRALELLDKLGAAHAAHIDAVIAKGDRALTASEAASEGAMIADYKASILAVVGRRERELKEVRRLARSM